MLQAKFWNFARELNTRNKMHIFDKSVYARKIYNFFHIFDNYITGKNFYFFSFDKI